MGRGPQVVLVDLAVLVAEPKDHQAEVDVEVVEVVEVVLELAACLAA